MNTNNTITAQVRVYCLDRARLMHNKDYIYYKTNLLAVSELVRKLRESGVAIPMRYDHTETIEIRHEPALMWYAAKCGNFDFAEELNSDDIGPTDLVIVGEYALMHGYTAFIGNRVNRSSRHEICHEWVPFEASEVKNIIDYDGRQRRREEAEEAAA